MKSSSPGKNPKTVLCKNPKQNRITFGQNWKLIKPRDRERKGDYYSLIHTSKLYKINKEQEDKSNGTITFKLAKNSRKWKLGLDERKMANERYRWMQNDECVC